MKECLNAIAKTLFEGKQKDKLCEKKIKQILLSASKATRKSEILADDVLEQLDAVIRSAALNSLGWDFFNLRGNKELFEALFALLIPFVLRFLVRVRVRVRGFFNLK